MQHTVDLQLEGASPQHTAASGVSLQGAAMPEPDLETKPWSSLAADGQERGDHMRWWFGGRLRTVLLRISIQLRGEEVKKQEVV